MTPSAAFELPAAAEGLVPHRPPMLLITRLLEAEAGNGMAEAVIGADCPFLDEEGRFESAGLVELGAQAYAAIKGLEFLRAGVPFGAGFLVGIQGMHVQGQARRGETLLIQVRTVGTFEDFAVVEAAVKRDGKLLAEGRLKVYAPGCTGEEQ